MEPNLKEILDGVRDAFQPQPVVLTPEQTGRQTPTIMIPAVGGAYTEHQVSRLALASPLRIEQTVTTRRVADFLAYVNRYKNDASLLVIAPEVCFNGRPIVTAILDYHKAAASGVGEAAQWGLHVAHYVPQISPAYALLTGFADKLLGQDEFTGKLRDVMRFVTSIEKADLLDILRTLTLTSTGNFKSIEDPISGSVDFAYDVQVQANAGTAEKRLTIPESINFKMPILHDGDTVEMQAELRYRVPKADEGSKKVQMGLALINRTWDELDQLETLGAKVAGATGLLTIVGDSKNHYRDNSK